ncbi:MFS transporter [Boudabousia liubingyangii]|uniref:MFS transporter n=1 Tax=Boudabousia liubingyangii TaxID=1921764 RepID=A0A1Q5PLC3_9ACTO|nr:MFS transporter [Boudabousia liubingyangii]OKL47085.1 MFS transporter [Boudabousia liubingyangii]OKL47852.1 MFS transporter [Boudabousia liubingyangii]
MSRTFDSLKYPNYRIWFVGTTFAATAVWMQRVAQDWVVYTEMTNQNAQAIGLVTALQFAPQLFLSPYAGVVVDRLNRRRLIQLTQSLMVIISIVMAVLLYFDVAKLWHFYLLAALGGMVQTFDNPARQIFVNELVPSPSVPNAVGLNSASFNLARMLGPTVAGAALAVTGSWVVFGINALLLLAPVIALGIMKSENFYPSSRVPSGRGQVREGLRYLKQRHDILVIMAVAGVVSCLGLNFQLTSAVMAKEVYHRDAGEFGLLGSFMAIGSLTGALLAARRANPRVRTVVGAAFGFGVIEALLALAPTYWTFAIISIPLGFFALTMITSANAAIQITTDPQMRGRVMSIYTMVFLGVTPVGSPFVGWVANTFGPRWSIMVGAIGSILISAIAALWIYRHWDIVVDMQFSRPFIRVSGSRERLADAMGNNEASSVIPETPDSEGEQLE